MELRDATPQDAAEIAGIVLAVAHHAYADLEPVRVHDLDPEAETGEWRRRLADPTRNVVRVVEHGDRVVAGARWRVARPGAEAPVRSGALTHLLVHPAAQNAGVGGALLTDAERTLRALGGTEAELALHRDAWWAARFLAARGWERDDATPPDDRPTKRWRRTL